MNVQASTEFSFLRAPYEELNSLFHVNKRNIEKEVSFAASHLKTMHRHSTSLHSDQAKAVIKGLLARIKTLRSSLDTAYAKEDACLQTVRVRLDHLQSPTYIRTRPLRSICDHYARFTCPELSEALARKAAISPLVDLGIFSCAARIVEALRSKDTSPALEWCDAHKSKLKRLRSVLEFNLKLQKFIELVKDRNMVGAITFARTHMGLYPDNQAEMQAAMVLLLVSHRPQDFQQYSPLLDESRWEWLIELFQREVLRVYDMPQESSLIIMLRAGMLALKTPLCQRDDSKAVQCPMCGEQFTELGRGIANGFRNHTSLLCRILHQAMNELNVPLALPNGQVYSEHGIKQRTRNGSVQCPITSQVFQVKDASKIYGLT